MALLDRFAFTSLERQVLGADDATSTETNDVVTGFNYTDGTGGVPAGLLQTVTDPRGHVTRYEYDARGRIVQAIYAEGTADEATESFEYDAADNLTAFVDGLGRRTESTYDAVGNLVAVTLPDPDGAGGQLAPTMQFTYDLLNRQTSSTDPLGRTTDIVYERFGRTIKTIAPDHDGDGQRSESVVLLNALGLAVSATDGLGRTTTYAYDSLHRVSQITSPDPDGAGPQTASTQTLAYDRLGRIVGATDALGRTTVYQYDRVGNLIAVVEPDADLTDALPAPKTTFTYNAVNELTSVTDALGRKTTYSYDTLGRLTRVTLPDPDGTGPISASAINYAYDAAGNLIRETDPLGRATNYEYDARNRLTRVTQADPDGSGVLTSPVTTYAYDDANQLTSTTDPLGRTTTYGYDGLGRLVTLTQPDPDGAGPQSAPVWSYEYDAAGKLTRQIDPLGNATTYGYDAHDNLVSVLLADPDGAGPQSAPLTTYVYDDGNQLSSTTDPLGRTTFYAYDNLGRLTSLTQPDPDGAGPHTAPVWNYAYDAVGNLTTQTDPLGRVTTYGYDRLDRLVSLTRPDPDGAGPQTAPQMLWSYDNVGQTTSVTDPLGNVTHFAYDAMGRTTSVTDALGGVTAYAYDKNSNLTKITDALGRNTVFAYDALNRNTQITQPDPDGAGSLTSPVTKYKYDAAGQLVEVVNPLNKSTKYQYDQLGRLTTETDALNQSNTYTYDAVGNLLSAADPLGRTTQFQYDNLHRRTASIDPLGGTTGFAYDTAGNLIALTDPVGNVTSWTFDGLNRVTAETNELGATRQFAYDAVGNLTARIDRNGREIAYSYDNLDRRTEERWLDGASVVYTAAYAYDANDRLTNASDAYSAYTHTFDALGRITRIDNAGTPGPHVVMDQAFDAVGNRTSVSATVNGVADFTNLYTYDNLDRQTRVEQTSQVGGNAVDDKRVDFAYNSLGQFTAITRFADLAGTQEVVKTTYSYDAIHRLTTLKHADGPTTRAQYTFTYNAASEITRIVSPDGTVNYTHDITGQLTGADHATQPDETYAYDANGNRIGGGYVVAPNNRILSDGTYVYEYDAEGNRTRRTNIATGEYESYTWDHRNRLTSVEKFSATDVLQQSASYTYDVFDRRLSKSVDSDGDGPLLAALERFAYDGDQIALAFAGDGSLTNRYLYGPAIDQILADEQHVDGLFNRTLWALTDHLGTVRDLADDSGSVLNHLTYSAFGQILSETAPLHHIRFAFTGRDFDPETGLSYHRARYYDPILGRWLSEDPIGFAAGDANLSRYVRNAVTSKVDPSGLIDRFPNGLMIIPGSGRGTDTHGFVHYFPEEDPRTRGFSERYMPHSAGDYVRRIDESTRRLNQRLSTVYDTSYRFGMAIRAWSAYRNSFFPRPCPDIPEPLKYDEQTETSLWFNWAFAESIKEDEQDSHSLSPVPRVMEAAGPAFMSPSGGSLGMASMPFALPSRNSYGFRSPVPVQPSSVSQTPHVFPGLRGGTPSLDRLHFDSTGSRNPMFPRTESQNLWRDTFRGADHLRGLRELPGSRVVEGAMHPTGLVMIRPSSKPSGTGILLGNQVHQFPPGSCGMTQAVQATINKTEHFEHLLVTFGGFRFSYGNWYYVSPCHHCLDVFRLNPQVRPTIDLPPGIPAGLQPNTQFRFTPPSNW